MDTRPICRRCAHEKAHHVEDGCTYGTGTKFGACTCPGFNKRKARAATRATSMTPAEAFAQLQAEVRAAFARFAPFVGGAAEDAGVIDVDAREVLAQRDPKPEKVVLTPHKWDPEARKYRPLSTTPEGALLGKGERAVLTAIAQHRDGVTPEQLAVLTGYKRSSRNTYLQRLRAGGFVFEAEADELIGATARGFDALGADFSPLPTGAALRDHWLGKLPVGERTLLDVLCKSHPGGHTPEQLGAFADYARSSRNTYLQRLAARRLVVKKSGVLYAAKELFE